MKITFEEKDYEIGRLTVLQTRNLAKIKESEEIDEFFDQHLKDHGFDVNNLAKALYNEMCQKLIEDASYKKKT